MNMLFPLIGLVTIFAATPASEGTLTPEYLRCEYLVDPLGIDTTQPRLSWELRAVDAEARGLSQSAYQVQVAPSPQLLTSDRPDLWDSGKINSDETIGNVYAGKELSSGDLCYWRVRVWDQDDEPSVWSQPARWSVGLLSDDDWSVKWITAPEFLPDSPKHVGFTSRPTSDPNAAKWVQIDLGEAKRIDGVRLHPACGRRGMHPPGGEVPPGDGFPLRFKIEASAHEDMRDARILAYDVTDLLREGSNAAGAVLADGWYRSRYRLDGYDQFKEFAQGRFGDAIPRFLLQIEVEYADGSRATVGTDKSRRCTLDGPFRKTSMYDGVEYDARREIPGWAEAGFAADRWEAAVVSEPPWKLEITGMESAGELEDIAAVMIADNCPLTAKLETSDARLNKLWRATRMTLLGPCRNTATDGRALAGRRRLRRPLEHRDGFDHHPAASALGERPSRTGLSLGKKDSTTASNDKNVFDIQQGVAISIHSTLPGTRSVATIRRADMWGTRSDKYRVLNNGSVRHTEWARVDAIEPFYLFALQDVALRAEYNYWPSLVDIMPTNSVGIVTGRDAFAIDWSKSALRKRIEIFCDEEREDSEIRELFAIRDAGGYKLTSRRRLVVGKAASGFLRRVTYRPFDERWIAYSRGFLTSDQRNVMRHLMAAKNIALVSARSNKSSVMDHFFCSRRVTETTCGEATTQSSVFPLYIYPDCGELPLQEGPQPNVSEEFMRELATTLLSEKEPDSSALDSVVTAEDIFKYAYGVFHSPTYRARYLEFLKIHFQNGPGQLRPATERTRPRLPLPRKRSVRHVDAPTVRQTTTIRGRSALDLRPTRQVEPYRRPEDRLRTRRKRLSEEVRFHTRSQRDN